MIKKEFMLSVVTELFKGIPSYNTDLTNDFIKKLLKDIDITSALQKLERAVSGRKLLPISKKVESLELEKEIQERLNKIWQLQRTILLTLP